MKKGRIKKSLIKLIILILLILLISRTITLTLSKFESNTSTVAEIDIAFYVLNTNYQTMNINLDSLFPRQEPYVYRFSISNFDGENIAETDLEYDLKIRTTTNLPLNYKLYLNESYDDAGAQDIIQTNEIIQDDDNTYWRKLTTLTEKMEYREKVTNEYELVIWFPEEYNTVQYQNIIEGIEIIVDSHQIT